MKYTYMGLGAVMRVDHPAVSGGLTLDYTSGGLDQFGRIVKQDWTDSSLAVLDGFSYGYDANSNRLYKKIDVTDTAAASFSELYHANGAADASAYDGLDRLTAFNRGVLSADGKSITTAASGVTASQSWNLDSLGNHSSTTTDGTSQTQTFNTQNQITSIGGQTAVSVNGGKLYDNDGNMIYISVAGQPGEYYHATYDAWNHMVSEVLINADGTAVTGASGETAQYFYDGQGHRIAKAVQTGTDTTWTRTDYYYGVGGQATEERTGTVATAATVATVLSVQYIWSGGTPVCRFSYDASGALVQTLYYTTDANNNVTAIVDNTPLVDGTTNPNYGKVVERYIYDAYGTATFLDGNWQPTVVAGHANGTASALAYNNNVLFGCYTLNVETGMYSTQTRYYVPWLAVFASQDGIWATNLYTYCSGNPVDRADPSGQGWGDDLWNGGGDVKNYLWNKGAGVANTIADVAVGGATWVKSVAVDPKFQAALNNGGIRTNPDMPPQSPNTVPLGPLEPSVAQATFDNFKAIQANAKGYEAQGTGPIEAMLKAGAYISPLGVAVRFSEIWMGSQSGVDYGRKLTTGEKVLRCVDLGVYYATAILAAKATLSSAAESAVSPALRAGRLAEVEQLDALASTGKFPFTPTQAQIDSAAFKVIVGDAKYTPSGAPVGTVYDATVGTGLGEIKTGTSVLNSSYQLRLQTYGSLVNDPPFTTFTIYTSRPVNLTFSDWLTRWGIAIKPLPKP